MSLGFFKVIKYLFPRSKAFRSVADNYFRKFLKGMAYGPDNIQEYLENIYGDLFPETTRELEKWENQFGVVFAKQYDENIRRNLLKSFWNINTGGQSVEYLQQILQLISPDFHVIENLPVRDPRDSNAVYAAVNGNKYMVNGNKYAVNGRKLGDSSFVPTVLKNDTEGFYSLPSQSSYWVNCFFICKSVVRNRYKAIMYVEKLQVEAKWKDFIEYIVLKIKPAHTTGILFVEYI
jgi:hypothetical protein